MHCFYRWAAGLLGGLIAVAAFAHTAAADPPQDAQPLKVCLVSGSAEYDSDTSLAAFQTHVEEHYNVDCTLLKARGFEELPGLEALDDCDVALFFTRRLTIDGEQLERVKKYCLAGRPIVAVRTASHGFQNWLEFDKLILGGNYQGHYPDGPETTAKVVSDAPHPALEGVPGALKSPGSLYKTSPLADDCTVLMTGSTPGEAPEPLAWTRTHADARIFYTSLGHPKDFDLPAFRRLLANALFWAAQREVERKE